MGLNVVNHLFGFKITEEPTRGLLYTMMLDKIY